MKSHDGYSCRAEHFRRSSRRVILGTVVITLMGMTVTACGDNQPPSTPTTSTTTTTGQTATQEPIEQQVVSPSGPNSFSPTVLAPPAPVEPPGVHHNY